jgi:hypothetical protein
MLRLLPPVDEREDLGHAAGQLQFELQFTLFRRDSRRFSGARDLRRCMSVDVRARRAAARQERAHCVPDRTVNRGDSRSLTGTKASFLTCIRADQRHRTRSLLIRTNGSAVRQTRSVVAAGR